MAAGAYNNPMLGQSISKMISAAIGSPYDTARAELAASEALLNNQTAQYRDAIGDTGLSGDLASMMIRSLQAGPDYARYAPTMADNALKYGAMGFNPNGRLTPDPSIAGMILSGLRGARGARGGSTDTADATGAGYDWNALTASAQNGVSAALRRAVDNGQVPAGTTESQLLALLSENSGGFATPQAALNAILSEDNWKRDVVDPNTWKSGGWIGERVANLFQDPEYGDPYFVAPGAAPGTTDVPKVDTSAVIGQARDAIARGADKNAVIARLKEMGIDPGDL